MCGTCFVASSIPDRIEVIQSHLLPSLSRRGPDLCNIISSPQPREDVPFDYAFLGTVLSLRRTVSQPLQNDKGDLFTWNGELFGGKIEIRDDENDALKVFEQFDRQCDTDGLLTPEVALSVINNIMGPFALVYYEKSSGKIWFCRDYLGRRSLLWSHQKSSEETTFVVSSVAKQNIPGQEKWQEVPVKVLHCFNMKEFFSSTLSFEECLSAYPLLPPITKPISFEDTSRDNFSINESVSCCYVNQLEETLETALRRRCFNLPRQNGDGSCDDKDRANVGILFSGGIDSMVIAALADKVVPKEESIDLINVAFQQCRRPTENSSKRQGTCHSSAVKQYTNYDVPDRITGRQGLFELNPGRRWNFVEVDVDLAMLQQKRASHIADLVYPSSTVLDDSIGCALWFAASGLGKCSTVDKNGDLIVSRDCYQSKVKVLLAGMGADEQLGGYSRHRGKYQERGWRGLKEEMEMELDRIATRNLGRDDRCISDHGKEARFPFLDEDVVSFLNSVPTHYKCDPRLPRGEGEKILLRKLARKLGLLSSSSLPKRAIQFGSRIAKLEKSKEKGGDTCNRLLAQRKEEDS